MVTKKNKDQLNITISPYLKRKMDELIGDKAEFSGYSDLGSIAIAQFIERYRPPKMGVSNAPTGQRTEILSGCNNLAEIFGVHQ